MSIRVDLCKGAVQLPRGADCHLHSDARFHSPVIASIDLTFHSPFSTLEVGVIDPCLVKIDDSHSTSELVEHELCVVIAQDETSVSVAYEWSQFDWLVSRSDIVPQYRCNISLHDCLAMLSLDALLHLLCICKSIF